MSNSGHGNYYNMDVSMHYSNIPYGVYLPTVTFTDSNGDGLFTNTMRIAQLSAQGFTGFYEADFDGNITVIDEDAFYNDKKVCVVTINQVTDICGNAFKDCSNLRAVTLDTAVDTSHKYKLENIHEGAFENCSALKQIFIPDSVTSIPNSAFKGCVSLEVAVMGYGIPRNSVNGSIGANAFENCTSLTYFYIPETVTSVGADAFKNCSSLESLYIDDSVSSIGTGAFTTISSSCIVYVENDTTAYPNSLFPTNATKRRFKVVTVNHVNYALSYSNVNSACSNASISTSDYWKAKCTGSFSMFGTNVFNKAYISYDNLVSISIQGSNVTQIDDQCFIDLPVFQGLYIPSNITWIYGDNDSVKDNEKIVVNCNQCRQISFEQNCIDINFQQVTNSEKQTFVENGNLRAIILPHRLTKIISYMCQNNTKLQLVNIFQKNAKTDLNYFYKYNHFQSSNLEEIHLFVNNTTFYNGTGSNNFFVGCTNLKRIYIYNNHNTPTVQIYNNGGDAGRAPGANVFYVIKDSTANEIHNHSGWNLHTIFKTSVTTIPASGYDGDTNLKTITFEHGASSSLTITESAFRNTGITDGANHIKWNDRVTTIGNNAFRESELTSIIIPNNVTTIGQYAFYGTTNMTSCTLPINDNFTTIPINCFRSSGLTSIDIPDSVTSIGKDAFYSSSKLATVTMSPDSVTLIGDGAFSVTGLTTIILPDSVTLIGDGAFYACSKLKSFKLPNNPNFTTIPRYCFAYSLNWDSPQSIPHSVTTIGYSAFYSDSTLNNPAYLKLPPSFKNYVPYYQGTNVSETITDTDTSTFSTDKGLVLVYNHLGNYVVKNNTSAIFAMDRTGTTSNQLDFSSSYTINENNNSLQYFRKGILNGTSYNTTNASTLDTAYTNSPYAAAGPIEYKINGMDIGKRIAPYYTVYKIVSSQTTTRIVKLIPGWTKLGILAIGGGGSGGSGGQAFSSNGQQIGVRMGGGSGGSSGGIGFVFFQASELRSGLSSLEVKVGKGGDSVTGYDWAKDACGKHGNRGDESYVKDTVNGNFLIKAQGGGSGSGGWAGSDNNHNNLYAAGDSYQTSYMDEDKRSGGSTVRGYNADGNQIGYDNSLVHTSGTAGIATSSYAGAIINVGTSGKGGSSREANDGQNRGADTSSGSAGGVITNYTLNILSSDFGQGGQGGQEGWYYANNTYNPHSSVAGNEGVVIIFQYFT